MKVKITENYCNRYDIQCNKNTLKNNFIKQKQTKITDNRRTEKCLFCILKNLHYNDKG